MADKNNTQASLVTRFWKQHRLLVVTSSVLVFFAIVLGILPIFLQRGLTNFLIDQGATNVSIGDVDFNIFSGALVVRQAGYELVEENPFHCDEMSINVDIVPVFSNRIFIHEVHLDNCKVVINKPDEDTLIVNGFRIPLDTATKEQKSEATPVAPSEPWFVGLHRLHLSDIAITYRDTKITTEITIDNITLSDMAQWEPDFVTDYSIAIKVNNAPISLRGTVQPFHSSKSFTGKLQISDFDFSYFAPLFEKSPFVLTEGLLNTELQLASVLNAENKYEVNTEGNLENRNFKATINGDQLSQEKLQWSGKLKVVIDKLDFYKSISIDNNLQLTNLQFKTATTPLAINVASISHNGRLILEDQKENPPNTHLTGSTTVNNLAIVNEKVALDIASINAIEVKDFELSNAENILFPSLVVRDAKFVGKTAGASSDKKAKGEYLLSFSDLTMRDIHIIDQHDVKVTSINLKDIKSQIIKDKQGKLRYIDEVSQTFASPKSQIADPAVTRDKNNEANQPASAAAEIPINIKAETFELTGENSAVFKDYSVDPFFQINLHNLRLKLVSLDYPSPTNTTKITFSTDIDESGKFQLSGESQLFSPALTTNLSGKLTNFELHPMTSYTMSTSGRKIRHGLLSSDISIVINQRNLESKLEMIFKNLSLVKDDSTLAKTFDDTMPMPMEMAISLMEDKQKRIKLSVPVQGDLDNPAFQIMPAILTAMRKTLQFAALSYMKYALQPWGSMIFVGELLHGQMTKIAFDPVEFAPGEATLTDTHKEYLEKLSSLMQKTPQLELTVCGIATGQDSIPPAAKTDKQSQADQTPPAKTVDHETLLLLARQRADAVKTFLINEKQIAPERLHNCTPIFKDDINAKPAVDLVL